MKVAIMQPYFFPYIGYFSLINKVDEFILFDTPQFIRHGWIERNRILKPNGEPLYIRVPLQKHSRDISIKELEIRNSENWKQKIIAQLNHYKKRAPHYWNVIKLLNEVFKLETNSIVELNYYSLKLVCDYIGIKTPIKIWSKMDVKIDQVNAPDEWALNICKAINATSYYNPVGGASFFDVNKYKEENIDIKFLKSKEIPYQQFGNNFVPFLSIIDVLMFNSKEEVIKILDEYELV